MTDYPRTIDNGAGERLTFVAVRRDERGEYIECRNSVDPGAGSPMHVHHLQEEALTVERGTIGYQSEGGPEKTAGPGETVTFAPGESHRFWNAGEDELVCTGYVRPPANFEYFLTEVYASMRRRGGDRPAFFDGAYLGHHYRSEFELTEVPTPVRRLVFPVIAAAGRLLGLHRRFVDAPEPVGR
jgi:quercetin dioxygenase-like cupin family protein